MEMPDVMNGERKENRETEKQETRDKGRNKT
jgi:hypothetical protein